MPAKRRPLRYWLVRYGAAFFVLWVIVCGVLLLRTALALGNGRDSVQRARGQLDAEAIADGRPLPDLRKARNSFRTADAAVGNPLVLPLKLLPVLGRQLRSVDVLAGAAAEVTDAAVEALDRTSEIVDDTGGGGPARLEQVETLEEVVTTAFRRVEAVDDLGPRVGLVGPLADARNELAEELIEAQESLRDASAGATAAVRLLAGPRRYLVVAANNAEMRAGSGMWLTGGVLTTGGGRLDLGEVEPLYELADTEDGQVPIEDRDLRERWGARHPEGDWRTLMFSPRLPASAELGVEMWRASGQEPVDGVLVLDPVALAGVVRATGPVEVQGRRISGDEVVDEMLKEQYARYTTDAEVPDRRNELSEVARAAFSALDAGDWSPSILAAELSRAVSGRHLMAWSTDPVEQRGWEAAGMAGALRPDSLLVSVVNRGGNKLDPYLRSDAELRTEPDGDGVEVSVRLRFTNEAPATLPSYVAGERSSLREPGDYIGLVTVNVPGAARDVRIVEGEFDPVRGPDGPTFVVAADLRLARGEAGELEVRFRLPGDDPSLTVEPSARVPAVTWRHKRDLWQDSSRRVAKL